MVTWNVWMMCGLGVEASDNCCRAGAQLVILPSKDAIVKPLAKVCVCALLRCICVTMLRVFDACHLMMCLCIACTAGMVGVGGGRDSQECHRSKRDLFGRALWWLDATAAHRAGRHVAGRRLEQMARIFLGRALRTADERRQQLQGVPRRNVSKGKSWSRARTCVRWARR